MDMYHRERPKKARQLMKRQTLTKRLLSIAVSATTAIVLVTAGSTPAQAASGTVQAGSVTCSAPGDRATGLWLFTNSGGGQWIPFSGNSQTEWYVKSWPSLKYPGENVYADVYCRMSGAHRGITKWLPYAWGGYSYINYSVFY